MNVIHIKKAKEKVKIKRLEAYHQPKGLKTSLRVFFFSKKKKKENIKQFFMNYSLRLV